MLLGHIPTCDAGPHILAIHLAHQAALEQAVQDHAPPATTIYQTQLNNLQAQWGEGVANDARTTQSFLRTARRRIARTFPEIPAHAAQLDVDAIPHKYQVIVTNQVEQLFLMHFEVIGNAPAAGPDNLLIESRNLPRFLHRGLFPNALRGSACEHGWHI